jgi:hypothetical protein
MKTLIIAFWSPDPATGADSETFRLHKSMIGLMQEEGMVYVSCFKEYHFREQGRKNKNSKINLIRDFILDQFLFTKCKVMVIVINESLKEPFLRKIGYHKAAVKQCNPAPAIPGEVFGEDDKIFVYLQDKEALGFFSSRCCLEPAPGRDRKILRSTSNFRFN